MSIDEARKQLFTKKGRAMEAIPLQEQLLYNMSKGQYIRGGIAGVRHSKFL